MRKRIPRSRGATSGVLIVLLGLWAGLVPFVGPYFHFAMHSNQHWQWFADRGWLEVLPAGVAILGGLMLIRGTTRASMSLGALLGLAAGLWFAVGPNISMLWNHGIVTVGPPMGAHTVTRALEWIGFFYGVGALLILFSAYALGFFAALPVVDERIVGTEATTGRRRWRAPAAGPVPTATTEPAPAPAAPARDTAVQPAEEQPTQVAGPVAAAPAARTAPSRRLFRRRRETTRA